MTTEDAVRDLEQALLRINAAGSSVKVLAQEGRLVVFIAGIGRCPLCGRLRLAEDVKTHKCKEKP